MNSRQTTRRFQAIALIAASLTAGSAFADGDTPDYPKAYTSSVSRAQVQADTIAALRGGQVAANEYEANQYAKAVVPSSLVRVQVLAEAREARRLGLVVEGDGTQTVPTASQLEQVRLAGVNAVNQRLAQAR